MYLCSGNVFSAEEIPVQWKSAQNISAVLSVDISLVDISLRSVCVVEMCS